ncbi:MAG: hypothetical protein FJW79_10425 [Actinobacteria bacterium]|nr:hypothetical protein [Actinomycetota bacterium]
MRSLRIAFLVLLLGSACGGTGARESWCAEHADGVVFAAVILADLEGTLGDTPWDWTPLWGEEALEEMASLFRTGDDGRLAEIARAANREAFDRACSFGYDLLGHLTHEEHLWCADAPEAVSAAGERSWNTDSEGWPEILADLDGYAAACRSAFQARHVSGQPAQRG